MQTLELRELRTLVDDLLDREKSVVHFLSELLLWLELGLLLQTGLLGLLFGRQLTGRRRGYVSFGNGRRGMEILADVIQERF